MKIWKFRIFWEDGKTIIKFPRKLSVYEKERALLAVEPGRHVHRNPKRKPKDIWRDQA